MSVSREQKQLYWQIVRNTLALQANEGWGAEVIERLANELRAAFPDMKGFWCANLTYMRAFAEAWPDPSIVQHAVGQLHRDFPNYSPRRLTSRLKNLIAMAFWG
ncbi:DUF1016 N-terminal domain-containing protein [Pseudomonas helleri]|uniref:DUF1016 N-terminal domain-containing protein n=1 Tax=Pseudomonas helleri TaxID=1608996 RepID=UPI0030DB02D8